MRSAVLLARRYTAHRCLNLRGFGRTGRPAVAMTMRMAMNMRMISFILDDNLLEHGLTLTRDIDYLQVAFAARPLPHLSVQFSIPIFFELLQMVDNVLYRPPIFVVDQV